MDNQANNNHFRLIIVVVFLVSMSLVSFLIYRKMARRQFFPGVQTDQQKTRTVAPEATFGSAAVKIGGGQKRHSVTDYLTLEIVIDSGGTDVVGYDLLVGYDKNDFELIQADSFLPDFQLFKMAGKEKLTITGTKKPAAGGSNILNSVKTVSLTFRPVRTGRFLFSLLAAKGKEKTQFVDVNSKVYQPQLRRPVEIEIF